MALMSPGRTGEGEGSPIWTDTAGKATGETPNTCDTLVPRTTAKELREKFVPLARSQLRERTQHLRASTRYE
jgi:hypothetical protein